DRRRGSRADRSAVVGLETPGRRGGGAPARSALGPADPRRLSAVALQLAAVGRSRSRVPGFAGHGRAFATGIDTYVSEHSAGVRRISTAATGVVFDAKSRRFHARALGCRQAGDAAASGLLLLALLCRLLFFPHDPDALQALHVVVRSPP